MWVLPSDFALPPGPYLAGLVLAAAAVVLLLLSRRPPVTEGSIAALSPWMAAGGGLYALYQVGAIPPRVAPLFGSPAVYVTVTIAAGTVWAAVGGRTGGDDDGGRDDHPGTDDDDATAEGASTGDGFDLARWETRAEEPEGPPAAGGSDAAGPQAVDRSPGERLTATVLAATGTLVLVATLAVAGYWIVTAPAGGDSPGGPALSLAILGVTAVLTGVVWAGLRRNGTGSAVGLVGLLAVFGHVLDGVSTAVGYDLLGFGEQTPLSQLVISLGAAVSPAWAGAGWLFVLVKLALAAGIVVLFESYVREEPTEGYLLLGMIVGVGLGPGVHNVVLFAIA